MREKISFNKNWRFHKGDVASFLPSNKVVVYYSAKTERELSGPASRNYSIDDFTNEEWSNVDLPHDFVVGEQPERQYNEGLGFVPYDNAWYVKKFKLTEDDRDKRITLYFEGVATHSTVYLNGCLLKRNFTGYTPFEVDITDVLDFDKENTLSVYVNTEHHEGWWYEGGGIYRNVWLIKTEKVSIDLYGVYAAPRITDGGKWIVDTELTLRNDSIDKCSVGVIGEIFDIRGKFVARTEISCDVRAKDKNVINYAFTVENPDLWSPEVPSQYVMRTRLFDNGKEIDSYDIKFGFRTVVADAKKGLFINGKHYKIQGVCGHADCGLMGKAVPDNIHRYKVELIKEMGANGYRTTHYPQAEALMDALDANGFIVMNEVRWFESTEDGVEQLKTLVKRDRNRPGVVFWSIGNEEPHHVTEVGRRISQRLLSEVRRLDKTRYVMTAINITPENATVCDELDVIGVNYCWDAYSAVHEKYPDKPVISSENCATGTTRGWYFDNEASKAFISAYDHDTNEMYKSREYTWKFISERDWMLGGYQWIAFEHRGEAMWPRLCSQSGAIDLFLQKKDAFYQNMSHWTEKPMVHILPHWNFKGLEGEPITVFAYTNTSAVELFVNGKSFGKKNIERFGHGEWSVPYEYGKIEAVAYDGEKIVARDLRVTSGRAIALRLNLDTENISANGEDIAIFSCFAVDEDGNEVYDAEPFVRFSSNEFGTIYSTGSDITDHTSIFLSERKMRAGRISVAVKLSDKEGKLKIYAHSDGLESAVIYVNLRKEI